MSPYTPAVRTKLQTLDTLAGFFQEAALGGAATIYALYGRTNISPEKSSLIARALRVYRRSYAAKMKRRRRR